MLGETRGRPQVGYANHSINTSGHEIWRCLKSEEYVSVHQLLAIADGTDPHEVFAEDTVCHHTTYHPRDNRRGVVEILSRSEHTSLHRNKSVPQWKQDLIEKAEGVV